MPSPIDFTDVSAGQVVSASTIKGNFDKINTYLNSTKVATGFIANPHSLSCISYNFATVDSGSSPDIHYTVFRVPQDIIIVDAQLYMRTVQGSPTVEATLYKTYNGTSYSNEILGNALQVTTANDWDTDSSPSISTITTNGYIYAKITNTNSSSSNNGLDVTLSIWFKTLHKT